tara:strand:+ start:4581 stop:4778 length:198 start_codon:yes stop_codon:yes gene_type:complete
LGAHFFELSFLFSLDMVALLQLPEIHSIGIVPPTGTELVPIVARPCRRRSAQRSRCSWRRSTCQR